MTEQLPGRKADLVKRLFARGEAFDAAGFSTFFTETPLYQFGNNAPETTRAGIQRAGQAFFDGVAAVYHDIKMMWEVGDAVFVEMDVVYTRHDGSKIALPCCDIFRLAEGQELFTELRIFMDVNPVADPYATVPATSSVRTLNPPQEATAVAP